MKRLRKLGDGAAATTWRTGRMPRSLSSSNALLEWPLLAQGFRAFFLAAGLWALCAMVLWLAVLFDHAELGSAFDPVAWHAHELIFGYGGAAVAGFLLTAIPNWTGRLPVRGGGLGVLVLLWVVGRVAVLTLLAAPAVAAAIDLAFPVALAAMAAREIAASRNWRNLPVAVALATFGVANALTHFEALGLAESGALGRRLGAAVLLVLIALIGGRIIPSFTSNWLKKRGAVRLPAKFDRIDRIGMGLTVLALAGWVAAPDSMPSAALAALGAAAAALRLSRWRGLATLSEPLLWALHLGYAWLAAGLALVAATVGFDLPASAGWHALFTGAIGTMTLAVMTRATLGHTGQALHADWPTGAAYLLVTLSAVLRLVSGFAVDDTLYWLAASGGAWSAAFGLFLIRYAPLLAGRRS